MRSELQAYWENHPLRSILFLSLLFRLVSILFSKGYGMHDDHYLVIEAAQSWIDGYDYNGWLPENSEVPTGHSFFYVGLHYVFFRLLEMMGIFNPDLKMYFVRAIHGLFSLLSVLYSFRITHKISNLQNAKIVAMLMGLMWFLPILSVRNMVEMVCIPFTLMGFWHLIQNKDWKSYFIAGCFFGIAIAIRIQVYLLWGGIGLVLLFRKQILQAALFGVVSIITLFLTQITDLYLWGYPFAEIGQYVLYNSTHYDDYIAQGFFQYFLVVIGLMIPPVSLYLLFGYFRTWKKFSLLFLPTLIFLLFHSFYPNKQERFILPIIPYIVILGVIGWSEFRESSSFWSDRQGLYKGSIRFFWILNTVALLFVSGAYTKESRVETMLFLRNQQDVQGLFLERSVQYGCYLLPRFYGGNWHNPHYCFDKEKSDKMSDEEIVEVLQTRNVHHILIIESVDLDARKKKMENLVGDMELIETIQPSYIDQLLHFLNPRNQNETVHIYRIEPPTG